MAELKPNIDRARKGGRENASKQAAYPLPKRRAQNGDLNQKSTIRPNSRFLVTCRNGITSERLEIIPLLTSASGPVQGDDSALHKGHIPVIFSVV